MLSESGLPKSFWSEAILCANYTLNRCPTRSTGKIPAIEWYQNEVNYSKLRPFGCVCFIHIPKEKRQKFDSHSAKGIMVGYATIGYRIYNLETKKVQLARNIVFDEGQFYKDLFTESDQFTRSLDSAVSSDDEGFPDAENTPEKTTEPQVLELRRSSRIKKVPARLDNYEVTIGYCEALLVENLSDPIWDEPKHVEMKSMQDYGVWELVPRPSGVRVLRSK